MLYMYGWLQKKNSGGAISYTIQYTVQLDRFIIKFQKCAQTIENKTDYELINQV